LPGITLEPSVEVTNDVERTVTAADAVLFVTPSAAIRPTAARLASIDLSCRYAINLAKGIDIETGQRMTEVIAEELPGIPVAAVMGPSHAEEVARDVPTAMVAASVDLETAREAQVLFSTDRVRVYTSDDPIGVEFGAALKNIVAIAAGIADGMGYESADNLKGALITRGLAEITRLGVKMGAQPETFAGLSGIGDLVTTCLSRHSRNRYVGEQLGRGKRLAEILAEMTMVAEGVNTTKAALRLAEKNGVDMPIARAVGAVLFGDQPADQALAELMTRPLQPEIRR
jgi:glycerol-3-phosphate dehydrogenase (NAD(P)+)